MDKENSKSAAGLRRSAVAERIRIREEWSALKGVNNGVNKVAKKKQTSASKVLSQQQNIDAAETRRHRVAHKIKTQDNKSQDISSEVLHGVVVLVDIGCESRAESLRATLSGLGATVVLEWSPLVTHLVWDDGGSSSVRHMSRHLGCSVVSPLWVGGCLAAARRQPERAFPAAARPSDLPSPTTLRILLKKADAENIPLFNMSDSKDDSDTKLPRLRISSDTSHDKSTDTSIDIQSRVNTALRRALPVSTSPEIRTKSRRKLFTHKPDGADVTDDDTEEENTKTAPSKLNPRLRPMVLSQKRKEIAQAERMARQIIGTSGRAREPANKHIYRIVLTGMSREERSAIHAAARDLGARIQNDVNKKTTHVVLGSCQTEHRNIDNDITGVSNLVLHRSDLQKARTLKALQGAARGCVVVTSQWIKHSIEQQKWIHHYMYEVPHLRKISQKARVERAALCRNRSEYAYDIFNGTRIRITSNTEQRDAAISMLNLCGAVTVIGDRQDGGAETDIDVTLGSSDGRVHSKWVFDSVAAGRMRTIRRYVVNSNSQMLDFTQTTAR